MSKSRGLAFQRQYTDKKTGKAKWTKMYYVRVCRNGVQDIVSLGTRDKREAERKAKEVLGDVARGKLPGVVFDRVMYTELADDLKTWYRLKGRKSIDRLKLAITHLDKSFKYMRAVEITTAKITEYIVKRRDEEGAANATINRELSTIRRMMNLGREQTPPKIDRVPKFHLLPENNIRRGFFETEEFETVRKNLPEYYHGIVTIGFKYGCRYTEIVTLKWSQLDDNARLIRLEQTKNGEQRSIPIDDEIKSYLEASKLRYEAMCKKHNSTLGHWVFLNNKGTGRVKRFGKAWKNACAKAKCSGRIFHDLRRTAVRNMVRAGVPEVVAMAISGHKTRSIFDRYNIVNGTDLHKATRTLNSFLEEEKALLKGKAEGKVSDLAEEKKKREAAN